MLALVLVDVLVIRSRGGRPPKPQGFFELLENDDEHERRFAGHAHVGGPGYEAKPPLGEGDIAWRSFRAYFFFS